MGFAQWVLSEERKKETRKTFANSFKFMPVIFISLGNPKELNIEQQYSALSYSWIREQVREVNPVFWLATRADWLISLFGH